MRSSSIRYERNPARRHAPLGRFAAVALAATLLAACHSPALEGGDRFNRTASADSAASAAASGGERLDRAAAIDRAKRAIYRGPGNQR